MKYLFVIPVLIATMLAAVACGSTPPEAEEPAPVPTEAPTATAQATTETAAPTSAPAASAPTPATVPTPSSSVPVVATAERTDDKPVGGVFNRLWADPPTLDPHKSSDTTSAGLVIEIFSGLVTLDTDLRIVPDIAESWEVSDDGLVYTFTLLPNAVFHDGTPITAQDFVYSINRAADPDLASPVASTYLNDIVGISEVLSGEVETASGVRAIDDRTLQITIDGPKAYFLAKLTYPTAFVVDKKNVEEGGVTWTDMPNGSGPFKLVEYQIGERIILERNALFYRDPAYLDRVVMNLAGGQAMAMYENDEIDITGVSIFDLDRLKDPEEPLSKELQVAPPGFSVFYVGFNTSEPPFDDVHFRRALNLAIDKELIATEVLGERVTPAYGILPPGFPGFNGNLQGLTFDEAAAKEELANSKYADPAERPRIVLSVSGTGGDINIDTQVVLQMWEEVLGVQVEIQQVEWATYLQDLNRRRFQVFSLGWQADYPDPQDFLDILFHTESETNHGGYSNAEVDDLLEKARVEQDNSERISLYNQAEQLIVDDAAWVPLWYTSERHLLLKPYIKGYSLLPMSVPKLRFVYIDDSDI